MKPAGKVGGQGAQTCVKLGEFQGEFGFPEKGLHPRKSWNFFLVQRSLKVTLEWPSWA